MGNIYESIVGDINNKVLLQDELLKFKPDFVFHFAAQALLMNLIWILLTLLIQI